MKKIEITDDVVLKIAAAELKKFADKKLDDMPNYICAEWEGEAREMLDNYNRVVEILGVSEVGYCCLTEQH